MAPEPIHSTKVLLPHVRLVQGYGLSETGFLTALLDNEHTPDKLTSCGRPCPGIDVRVVDQSGTEVSDRSALAKSWLGARNVMRGNRRIRRKPLLRSGTAFFELETSAVRMRTVISTSWTA